MSDKPQGSRSPDDAPSRDPASDRPKLTPGPDDRPIPGGQERPMTEEETRDEALEETFPASDPVPPSRIDGPNN